MRRKTLFNWVVVFSALGTFTAYTLGGIFVDPAIAYAKSADSEMNLKDKSKLVVFKVPTKEDREEFRFLKKFEAMYDHDLVCEIDQSQLDALSESFDTEVDTVELDGKEIDVAKISGKGATGKKIMDTISPDGTKLRCRPVKVNKAFYLLFNASVS